MYVAVYGSLRTDSYNYERIQRIFPGNFELLKTSMLPGFKMYDLGYYPAIIKTDNEEDLIYVEVMECNKEAFNFIEAMEYDAGYSKIKVNVDGYDCYIFIMKENQVKNITYIESGDYFKYLDKNSITNV